MRKKVQRMTSEEITTLARGIVTGKTFYTTDTKVASDAFGFIIALASAEWADSYIKQIGGFWAPWEKAGPVFVNGSPFFTQVGIVHRKDVPLVEAEVERMSKALA